MSGAKLGSLIGAVGGLVFVLSNAGALSSPWPLILRVSGVLAFIGTVALVLRATVIGSGVEPTPKQMRAYGFTVLAQVLAFPIGSGILTGVLNLPAATLPWVAAVVGVHFLVFARVFREPVFLWLGAAVTVSGVAGLVMAAAKVGQAPVSLVGGIVPGVILLASVAASAVGTSGAPGPAARLSGRGPDEPRRRGTADR